MKKIVVKFGGSNLKETGDIQKLLDVIKFYNRPLAIVVSAFYGITNKLIEIINKAKDDEKNILLFTDFLAEMKENIINHYIKEEKNKTEVLEQLDIRLNELRRQLLGINYLGEIPEFIEDAVLSYGEKLSALIITAIIRNEGLQCEEVLPEDLQLITDGEYGNASVDFNASRKIVGERLSADKVFIIPGFYGISKEGRKTIFGRGGSDYSAAAIAACIDAESLDIWKDVDGFQSADPKLVADAVTIPRLFYGEAAELAYFGAKILHPRTVEPLLDKNIPIRIFNINKIDTKITPLTIIGEREDVSDEVIKSVTYSDDFCVIRFSGPGVGIKAGLMAIITRKLEAEKINIKLVFNTHTHINLFFAASDVERAYSIIKDLPLSGVNSSIMKKGLSTIAVVGCGMMEKLGIAARLFSAVAKAGINIETINFGASDVVTYFIVEQNDRDKAIKAIHKEFFNNRKLNLKKNILMFS
ncbi:MAG TPA: aspartate kinase [Bacteroidales bacterium]|nr:aspartate kinase [Bacteroidales bacterium]HPS17161.1 aspartate kinase [Bacteroidales bacterium]